MILRLSRLITSTGRRQRPRNLIGQAAGASARPGSECGGHPAGAVSGPGSVLDRIKWPVAFHPREDGVVQDRVERGAVRAYPGSNGRVPVLGAAARLMAAGRVDVHAA